MATHRRMYWVVLLAMLPWLLILPTSVYSQDFLNPEYLPEIDDFTFDDSAGNRRGEITQMAQLMEKVNLPTLATPFSSNGALVLVRANMALTLADHSAVLAEIYFDAKRHLLKHKAAQIIEESAALLREKKTRILQVEAYCDTRGTTAYSLALGNQRANAVSRYLRNLGVPSSQVAVIVFGSYQHRCQVNSKACWQENRRINQTFHLLAMRHPQLGCLTRLRVNLGQSEPSSIEHTVRQPFLQKIHLAESY